MYRPALLTALLLILMSSSVLSQPTDLTQGLITYYPLNGGASDVAGSTEASIFGAVLAEDRFGNANGALYFDGVDDMVQVTAGGGLNARNTGTIALWAKWEGVQDQNYSRRFGAALGRQSNGRFSNTILDISASDPAVGKVVWSPYSPSALLTGRSNVGDGRWRHIVVTFSSAEHRLYIDGQLEASGASRRSAFHDSPGVPLTLGAWVDHGGGFFKGLLDDVRVYDRALSSKEVEALFALNPNAPDLTPREEVEVIVQRKLKSWSRRGKFEKVEDYEIRVNEGTRNILHDSLRVQAFAQVGDERVDWSTARNTYDPDAEVFTIRVEALEPFKLAVPIAEAEAFDANFRGVQYLNPIYGAGDGGNLLVEYVEVTDPESAKTYVYKRPQS